MVFAPLEVQTWGNFLQLTLILLKQVIIVSFFIRILSKYRKSSHFHQKREVVYFWENYCIPPWTLLACVFSLFIYLKFLVLICYWRKFHKQLFDTGFVLSWTIFSSRLFKRSIEKSPHCWSAKRSILLL